MRSSTVLKINELVFVMSCNESAPMYIGKCMFFVENLSLQPFLDFSF